MASVSSMRDGLKTNLATISGLKAYDTIPDQPMPPCAIVGPPTIYYDMAYQRGGDRYVFKVRVLVGRAIDYAGQDDLDGYLASSGATSLKAAIESDDTLGGACDTCRVTSIAGYGAYEANGVQYLGCEAEVEVFTSA